jgi:hypothetical protein
MGTHLIDLTEASESSSDNISGLSGYLSVLVGEPFQFARVSYGDELTLHFGDLRPALSRKLEGKQYGAYILGVRGSDWVLKSAVWPPTLIMAGAIFDLPATSFGKPLSNEDLEGRNLVEPGSRVIAATPFVVKPLDAFGLQLRMSDGSTLTVRPMPEDADGVDENELPELADWELSTPQGLLSAGPGRKWSFAPSKGLSAEPRNP